MSYYLQIGGDQNMMPLASNRGLGDLYRWIDTLDVAHFGEIVHLAEWGWCQRLPVLQAQLEDALSGDDAPTQHDVRATADNLLDLIKSRDAGAQTCHVTDGIGAGDGEDDDEADDQGGDDDGPDDDGDEAEEGEADDESDDETGEDDETPTTKAILTKGKMLRPASPMPTGETIAAALRELFAEQREEIASRLSTKSLDHVEVEFAEAVQKAEPKPAGEYYPWQTCAAEQFGAKVAAFIRVRAKAAREFDEDEVDVDTAAALSEVAHVPAVPVIDLSAWDTKMVARVAPLIEVVMRDSVKAMADVIVSSDPKAIEAMFHVVDKNIPETAQRLALKFCRETNETTSMEIGEALATLRDEIEAGIVGGDTRVEMTNRVREVFDNAEKYRAERIARTEASRARHTAEQKTVTSTGDEYKKHWLVSADACEKCDAVAAKFKDGIPAAATFGATSYGPIDGPPLHPHCACSLTWERVDSPNN